MARNNNGKSQFRNKNNRGKSCRDQSYASERDSVKRKKFDTGAIDSDHDYNDVSWYVKNPQMLKDSASFSFNRPLGANMQLEEIMRVSGQGQSPGNYISMGTTSQYIPGVWALHTCLSIGVANEKDSPVNLAAQNIYSYVRYMNSGSKNYDPVDLIKYLMTMDSVYACWNWLKRIYGYAMAYSQKNWYLPEALMMADYVNLDDIMHNLANFREYLNLSAARVSSYCVPAVMPLMVRHSWMFSNVYKDADNDKAQIYMFTPEYFYQYDEQSSSFGLKTVLVKSEDAPIWKSANLLGFQDLRSIMDKLLNALVYSEDLGVMSGDILKAYGQDKLFKITPVDENYMVVPVYNEEVLNQIHNAHFIGNRTHIHAHPEMYNIVEDTNKGILKWNPKWPSHTPGIAGSVFNVPWDDPNPENVMTGTRLTTTVISESVGVNQFGSCGTEFLTSSPIYVKDESADSGKRFKYSARWISTPYAITIPDPSDSGSYQQVVNNILTTLTDLQIVSNFDWHPLIYLFARTHQGSAEHTGWYNTFIGIVGDLTNWTVMGRRNVDNLNLTAIMSEFNIPQIGSF